MDFLLLANISCKVLKLITAISAYSAIFPPLSDDENDGKMAETKTTIPLSFSVPHQH